MTTDLSDEMVTALRTAPLPLDILTKIADRTAGIDVDDLFEGARLGNPGAARGLARYFHAATRDLAEVLVESGDVPSPTTLIPHLFMLPLVEGAYADAAVGVYTVALAGLRQQHNSPVSLPIRAADPRDVARFSRALAVTLLDELAPVARIKQILGVSSDDIGRWTGVRSQSVSAWERETSAPKPTAAARLARIDRLASCFAEVVQPERVVGVFRGRPVPLLGGRTYFDALDEGDDPDILIDVVRHGGGLPPETEAGARYLTGGAAAEALDHYEQHGASAEREESVAMAGRFKLARGRSAAARQVAPTARVRVAGVTAAAARPRLDAATAVR